MLVRATPIALLSTVLLVAACGGPRAAESAVPAPAPAAPAAAPTTVRQAASAPPVAPMLPTVAKAAALPGLPAAAPRRAKTPPATVSAVQPVAASDTGVTGDQIRLGSIDMFGMALASIAVTPLVRGILATGSAINDRGGVLGRRLQITTCDDGAGDVARSKTCLKKLVVQDRIFGLVTGADWATASIHDDLAQYHLPYIGAWAYSQTEWQDPFMFPMHMSMVHEAMAGARWVRDVIKPGTYGLLCLNSPEMQQACTNVRRILDASGSRMVLKVDVAPSETSMSTYVLAFRAARPDHIVHYVMNPATIAKFIVEAAQQGYWPPEGISGNHLAAELLGSVMGTFPAGRYWTNTTYKLWGPEFLATMNRYARANNGSEHHLVQVAYTALNIFARAATQVGPNLTRDGLVAALSHGVWAADASLDQRFAWTVPERGGTFEHPTWSRDMAQGREFMYRYVSDDTRANPDGSPSGLVPDDRQFVLHTND